jgi:hypothetical protein
MRCLLAVLLANSGLTPIGAYAGPSQFLGVIHYDTIPCGPKSGTVYTLPCPALPTSSPMPTLSPVQASEASITMSPSISGSSSLLPTLPLTAAVRILI